MLSCWFCVRSAFLPASEEALLPAAAAQGGVKPPLQFSARR